MDSPDATFAGDQGLLAHTPTPPMRPERRSGPVRDPIQGQSPVHLVAIKAADGAEVPASPGTATSHLQEAPASASPPGFPLHLAPNVGLFDFEKGVYNLILNGEMIVNNLNWHLEM